MFPSFADFYIALHDDDTRSEPRIAHKWQVRAANELAESGFWSTLKAPTGSGKTTLGEIWLYALAASQGQCAGRRLFWVVDRRSVVDQVFEHMSGVMEALQARSGHGHVRPVLDRLRKISGGDAPQAVLWRGGLDEATGADLHADLDPTSVAIICSTVDQVGSRLLFRGYGLSPGSRALHAGLIGIDSTLLIDEAHIARPFQETVAAVKTHQDRRREAHAGELPPTVRLLSVTATQPAGEGFALTDDEMTEATIARCLDASKPVTLEKSSAAKQVAAKAKAAAKDEPTFVVGIVLNTVGEARGVFEALGSAGIAEENRVLVIGPVRPLDRAAALDAIPARPDRAARGTPFFVVSTQTIEVGVDLDFDVLFTACAPIPALIQRVGRLDRRGERGESDVHILPPPSRACHVYGEETKQAWAWIQERLEADGGFDFGSSALARLAREQGWSFDSVPGESASRDEHAPILLSSHVAALSRTDGLPSEGPDVDLYLHGMRDAATEVTLFWRADIPTESGAGDDNGRAVAERIELRPPHSGETLTVSSAAADRWLRGQAAGPLADLPSLETGGNPADPERHEPPVAWRLERNGFRTFRATPVDRPRSGDLIVIASQSGGADHFGWAPTKRDQFVPDLGSLRLGHPRIVLPGPDSQSARAVRDVVERLEGASISVASARSVLIGEAKAQLRLDCGIDEPKGQEEKGSRGRRATRAIREHRYGQLIDAACDLLLQGRLEVVSASDSGVAQILMSASSNSVLTKGRSRQQREVIGLEQHQDRVSELAENAARLIGLPEDIVDDLVLAANTHDEGKRDPRFQSWLSAGAPLGEAIAKSIYPWSPRRVDRLRSASGWPKGKRHETASAALLFQAFPERKLPAWLAATHHGSNRPFEAGVPDTLGEAITVTGEVEGLAVQVAGNVELGIEWSTDTQRALTQRFGPWGLAFLEAILITADRSASRELNDGL